MSTLLIRHAQMLVTMDAQRREIADGAVLVRGPVIEAVGTSAELPDTADEVIDARNQIVIPGLVNTHHHMYQTLTRAIPAVQDCELFSWLKGCLLYTSDAADEEDSVDLGGRRII